MAIKDVLCCEFDALDRIVYLSYKEMVAVATQDQLDDLMTAFRDFLEQYRAEGSVYIIIDMSHLTIDPALSDAYVRWAGAIADTYAYPGGIARYGHQITRVTVRRGYRDHRADSPNLFGTRQEAYAYIQSLKNEGEAGMNAGLTAAPEHSATD